MNIKKFLNIDIEPAPIEMELDVELRCREIMKSNDVNNIKRYCTHLVRHKLEQDVFLAQKTRSASKRKLRILEEL